MPSGTLHSFILVVVTLLPAVAPSIGRIAMTESEAPLDDVEATEEAAIGTATSTQLRRRPSRIVGLIDVRRNAHIVRLDRRVTSARSGHRLSDFLLAPLRC